MRCRDFLILLALASTACATATRGGPEALAHLEQVHRSNPRSEPALRALGIAYYDAGRLPEARALLDSALKQDARDGTAALYLGLTAEKQNDIPAARAAYGTYVQYGRTRRIRRQLESRLAALQRQEIELQAKAAVQQEHGLASVAGAPNVIAVMPLSFSGADSSLRPLGRGLAELLTTDLAHVSALTVVERMRIQALVDELKLQQSGATDSSTNVRAGKILQAGRVVEGSILQQGEQLRVDAAVIDVPTTQIAGSANDDRSLEQLLTIEKNIALGILQQLRVPLSTEERNAIEQRPTRSLAAFLAFSRGLLSEDEGHYDEAQRYFGEAVRADPGFSAAQQKAQEAQQIAAGMQMTAQTIEASVAGTPEGRIAQLAAAGIVSAGVSSDGEMFTTLSGINPAGPGAAATDAMGPLTSPPARDPAAAGTGADNPANRTGRIEIRVQRP